MCCIANIPECLRLARGVEDLPGKRRRDGPVNGTTWFRNTVVPSIIASLGSAHAVSLGELPASARHDEGVESCEIVPPPALQRAVATRVRSFLAGRHCAARALATLIGGDAGIDHPIAIGSHGAPQWPQGIVGSITHSSRRAIAVVADATVTRGLGIDCEHLMSEAAAVDIAGRVLPEAAAVARCGDASARLEWPVFVTAVFSAKESIYKCLNPIVDEFFDFDAVALCWIDVGNGAMGFRVLQSFGGGIDAGDLLTVRFCVEDAHVFTALELTTAALPRRLIRS